MKISNREKRDWSLLIFVVPVGIFLMMIAGQIAVRIVPNWSVDAGMQSNLDLETAPKQQPEMIQPILPDILTPLSWFDTFLTPNSSSDDNVLFPPFIVFEASATPSPSPTVITSPTATSTSTVAATTVSPSPTIVGTPTATQKTKTPDDDTPTPGTPAPLCTDSTATNFNGPLPCTYPPTCTDVAANNYNGPWPCTYYTPVSAALVGTELTPAPSGINVGAPNGASSGTIPDGRYIILDLGLNPIYVIGPSETNYDFVYYEEASGSGILMDRVILSISNDNITYYVVFNWGDGIPDTNSNVGDIAGTEDDNQLIDQPDTGELYGTDPLDTGILVDVDNAPSHPPPGPYQYIAIQAPTPDSTDDLVVDSIQVTEVAPTP